MTQAEVDAIKQVVILEVQPSLRDGCYAVKRILGDVVQVRAHIIVDGHVQLGANLHVRYMQEQNRQISDS